MSRGEQIALLRAFYADHDPEKEAKAIDKIVDKRRGCTCVRPSRCDCGANKSMTQEQWEELDTAIEEKYGWPIEPTGKRLKKLWRLR